jgi:tRNA threonylcarbamoyladenosine biosynthesis protein TsaE
MNSATTLHIATTSSEQTEHIAEKIGAQLRGGEVIELSSDLGGGKTTFTRGLARGAGSTDRVASPTFTISREYQAPRFTIAHFDFYRLGEAGIVGDEFEEIIGDPAYVTVAEWSGVVHDVLPKERLMIQIAQGGEDKRELTLTWPKTLDYLMEGVN